MKNKENTHKKKEDNDSENKKNKSTKNIDEFYDKKNKKTGKNLNGEKNNENLSLFERVKLKGKLNSLFFLKYLL